MIKIVTNQPPKELNKVRWKATPLIQGQCGYEFSWGGFSAFVRRNGGYHGATGFNWGIWRAGERYDHGHHLEQKIAKREAKAALLVVIENDRAPK